MRLFSISSARLLVSYHNDAKATAAIAGEDWAAVFLFNLDNGEPFHIKIAGGEAELIRGSAADATHLMSGDGAALAKAVTGRGDLTHAISREDLVVEKGMVIDFVRLGRAIIAARRG